MKSGVSVFEGNYVSAIIPAAGVGARMRSLTKKQFLVVNDREILHWTLSKIVQNEHIDEIIVTVNMDDVETTLKKVGDWFPNREIRVISGGDSRDSSVYNGLRACNDKSDIVLIHDAVRPYIQAAWIDAMLKEILMDDFDGLALGKPVTDTLKRVTPNGEIMDHLDRSDIWRIETPQMFKLKDILRAHEMKKEIRSPITDDTQLLTSLGKRVKIMAYDGLNDKLTSPEELELAKVLLK